jgi:hypothetical protein
MQGQGILRRVSEFVVVNNAIYGKQMHDAQAITCHFDYGRITEAAANFEDLTTRFSWKMTAEERCKTTT